MLDIFSVITPLAQCANVEIPEATEQALSYYRSDNFLWILAQLMGLVIPALFLIKKFSVKLQNYSEILGKYWFFTIIIYLFIFLSIAQLLEFPFDFYTEYVKPHDYGLSTQSFNQWIQNYFISYGLTLFTAFAVIWIFYFLIKKSPRRWWIYGALFSIGFTFFTMFINPIWIDPLFNKFTPMKNKVLEEKILGLASKAGIQGGRVFQVDKSAETNTINAYVTGFGHSSRIVLWDTTINQMKPEELYFVMGHEMGHYVLHHIWFYLLYFSFGAFIVFYFFYKMGSFLVSRFGKQLGFHRLDQIASLPLFIILVNISAFLITPVSNAISRHIEHEADRFGLEITRNNEAAGKAFIVLQQKNLANPRPGILYTIWRGSHPSLADRIEFCNTYCPWRTKEPLKYEKHFKN